MNTARLAQVDRIRGRLPPNAEALGEEIDDPAAGLITRDYLDMRLAQFDRRFVEIEKRIAEFEARFTWKIIGLLGVQIVIFSLITKYL